MWLMNNEEKEKIKKALEKIEKIDKLEKDISELKEDYKNFKEQHDKDIRKVNNVLEHMETKPTYRFDFVFDHWRRFTVDTKWHLYIYANGKEHDIVLDELTDLSTDSDTAEFRVEDNIAYFNVTAYRSCNGEVVGNKTRYEFMVDYKSCKYICVRKSKVEN